MSIDRLSRDVQAAVVEGLLAPNEQAEYVPVLATESAHPGKTAASSWSTRQKMTVIYKLRPGVKWHDGQPFTSADVKFTWEAVKNEKFIAESKDGTEDIDSIETPDELTAICHYNTVASIRVHPLHLRDPSETRAGRQGSQHRCLQREAVGTGPFMVKEFKRGQYVLTRSASQLLAQGRQGEACPTWTS